MWGVGVCVCTCTHTCRATCPCVSMCGGRLPRYSAVLPALSTPAGLPRAHGWLGSLGEAQSLAGTSCCQERMAFFVLPQQELNL